MACSGCRQKKEARINKVAAYNKARADRRNTVRARKVTVNGKAVTPKKAYS
jgi:hypothetical protein